MAENSSKTRRNFMKTAGTAGIAGLAGCNTLSGDNSDQGGETDTPTETDTPQDPNYDIRVSALEYDLADLVASEANQHEQAYVEDNYSAELGVTVLENGEETGLGKLGDVHLEDEEGERVETTEEGYVPEYAVEDGQELTVRAEIDGETVEETITVTKELPSEFYADARIQEDGELLYDTDWSTPYNFDNHIVDRQAFLDQRAERRNELAHDEIILESDLETWRDYFEEEDQLTDEEKKEYYLGGLGLAMEGGGPYEGTGADDNAFNVEKAMLEHSPYENVFIGGFANPREPDISGSGDRGYQVDSQVAYVDGDWYHVGKENAGARHISEIDEIGMVEEEGNNFENTSASELAVSVLGEFEKGNTDIINPENAEGWVQLAVTSQVTLNGDITELELSDDISWNTLNEIRDNTEWEEVMVPMELATAIGTDVEGTVSIEGETTKDSKLRVTR